MQVWRSSRAWSSGAAHLASAVASATPSSAGPTAPPPPAFRVVTYNVLAQKYAQGGMHSYCAPEHLEWASRRARIEQELRSFQPDVLCLQEVEAEAFTTWLQPWLGALNLQGRLLTRQGERAGAPEGVALFVNEDLFEVVEWRTATFKDFAHEVAHAACTESEAWVVFQGKEEGVVMALLKHRGTGRKLLAACTHLFWNPRYPDVKVLQAAVLARRVADFAVEAGGVARATDLPLVVGGDFNSLPRKLVPDVFDRVIPDQPEGMVSGVYTLLLKGRLDPAHPDAPWPRAAAREGITSRRGSGDGGGGGGGTRRSPTPPGAASQQPQPLTNAGLVLDSMHRLALGREPTLTTKTATFAGTLDYIFLTPEHLRVRAVLDLPFEDDGRHLATPLDVQFPAIPDANFPSDHLAVGCVLELVDPLGAR